MQEPTIFQRPATQPFLLDLRNALIDLFCIVLLVPSPLLLAFWLSLVAFDLRAQHALGYRNWVKPLPLNVMDSATVWSEIAAGALILGVYSLAGGYAAPTPWRRIPRALLPLILLLALGFLLLYFDPSGSVGRGFD